MTLAASQPLEQMELFERYCTTYLSRVPHPFGGQQTIEFVPTELGRAIACVSLILETPVQEPRLSGLDDRFYGAFRAYIQTPRDQEGALVNAVEKLAQLVEPYLKKLVFLFYSTRTVQQGTSTRPLWYLGTEQILRELGFVTCNLKERQDSYWAKQPAEAGIWRIAYVSRHKGTHEAHTLDLPLLEKTAVAVTSAFLLAARHAMSDPQSSAGTHQHLQDALRFRELLRVRADTYHVTRELPTTIEHIRLYNVRQHITLDDNQARLLFRSYCAGRGPVFFFLRDRSRDELVRWAYEFSGDSDKSTARGAAAFLLAAGEYVKLKTVADLFNDYKSRLRLADYISRAASRQDLETLWWLILHHKSARVREAAIQTFSRTATRTDRAWLRRIANSTSPNALPLFATWISRIADTNEIETYRRNLRNRQSYTRQLSAIALGMVGQKEDHSLLEQLANRGRGIKDRLSAVVGLAMIAARFRQKTILQRLLTKESRQTARLSALGIGLLEAGKCSHLALPAFPGAPYEVVEALYKSPSTESSKAIRHLLKRAELNDIGRLLVLSLCRTGRPQDFVFLARLFAGYREEMRWDPYEIMSEVSSLAPGASSNAALIRKFMQKSEFWKYYGDKRPKDRLPVVRYENLVLMRGLIGLSFGKIAQRSEIEKLRRMLRHSYWAVNRGGANGLISIGKEEDFQLLLTTMASGREPREGELSAIIGFDASFYCQIAGVLEDFLRFGPLADVD